MSSRTPMRDPVAQDSSVRFKRHTAEMRYLVARIIARTNTPIVIPHSDAGSSSIGLQRPSQSQKHRTKAPTVHVIPRPDAGPSSIGFQRPSQSQKQGLQRRKPSPPQINLFTTFFSD